jgi:hypothetical protein
MVSHLDNQVFVPVPVKAFVRHAVGAAAWGDFQPVERNIFSQKGRATTAWTQQ